MALILLLTGTLCSLLGCLSLALGQKKHAAKVFGTGAQSLRPEICKRWAWFGLLLSLACLSLGYSGDFVIILWPMLFGINALLTALAITFAPGWLRVMGVLPGLKIQALKSRTEECSK